MNWNSDLHANIIGKPQVQPRCLRRCCSDSTQILLTFMHFNYYINQWLNLFHWRSISLLYDSFNIRDKWKRMKDKQNDIHSPASKSPYNLSTQLCGFILPLHIKSKVNKTLFRVLFKWFYWTWTKASFPKSRVSDPHLSS